MNTADLRDMNFDQKLFWAVSIPITVVVLGTAFLYGYKGEAIADHVSTAIQSRRRRGRRGVVKVDPEPAVISADTDLQEKPEKDRFALWTESRRKKKDRKANG
jgi:hypothetical protein